MSKREAIEQVATEFTKKLIDDGKLIEAGFAAFAHYTIPKDAGPIQLREMRNAFMAGAEHTFSSIMAMFDPGNEPTDADMRRMDLIQKEIAAWRAKVSQMVDPAQGNA